MSYVARLIDAGEALDDLASSLSRWSQATFGTDQERGPIGPIKHLKKECDEVLADPTNREEYADLLILVLDASRRAGIKPLELIRASIKKMELNKTRQWGKPVNDEPVEHLRDVPAAGPVPS